MTVESGTGNVNQEALGRVFQIRVTPTKLHTLFICDGYVMDGQESTDSVIRTEVAFRCLSLGYRPIALLRHGKSYVMGM